MTDEAKEGPSGPDPLVTGARRAAIHLGKAGFEVFAALSAMSRGIVEKVRPPDGDDEDGTGPQHIRVD
ncbi:MAG: hypothetical protein M5U23_05885 [Acidimicrobiia bacterium]|nr:hypothetical protein [Acidimicrobiia bacterium]